MRIHCASLVAFAVVQVLANQHRLALAQTKSTPKPAPKTTAAAAAAPAGRLKDGWEEIDKRLVFLMTRLANVEASLDAIEKKLGVNKRQQAARAGEAKRAEKGNEMMDRKGGGPVKWSQFYGRTAEKFFYHPTDRNTTYHTRTVLNQQSSSADNQLEPGVPSRQGLPVHQRPPQFDYIYQANRDAQARAEQEAQRLGNKLEALQARRRQLEDEQAGLWCQVAFRAVTRFELTRKPVYRFEPLPASADTTSRQQAEAVKAAAIFVRRSLSIVEEAEEDQAKAFANVNLVVADARDKFDDALIPLGTLASGTSNLKTAIGRFSALAGKLKDVADNLSDSYEVALDGDRFKDEARKDTFRGLLQESLVDYAQIVLALNEMAVLMAEDWKAKPDVNAPLKFASLELPERAGRLSAITEPTASSSSIPSHEPSASVLPIKSTNASALQGEWKAVGLQGQGEDLTNSEWRKVGALSIQGSLFSFVMLDGVYRGELLADATAIPKQVTFKVAQLERRKPGARWQQGMELRGVYRMDGDELTCCWIIWIPGVNELPRPTTFDTEKVKTLKANAGNPTYRNGQVKYVFRRRRDAAEPSADLPLRAERRVGTPALVEIRILRNGNWVYHPISYEGGKTFITRADGSKAELRQEGESLFFTKVSGGRFGFDLRNQKTSSGEPVSFIYK